MLSGIRSSGAVASSAAVLMIRISGIVALAVTMIALARWLDVTSLGIYATVGACAAITRLLGPAGLDQVALRGGFQEPHAPGATIFDAIMAVSLLNILVVAAAVAAWGAIDGRIGSIEALMITLTLPAFGLAGLLAGFIRAQGWVLRAQIPESIGLPFLGAALIITKHQWTGSLGLQDCLLILLGCSWLVAAWYLAMTVQACGKPHNIPRPARVWVFARESFHISTAFVFTALAARAPVIFGMALLGPAAAAVLEIASRFGTLGSVATSSVASTYATPLAQSAQTRDWARSSRLLKSAALLSFLGGLMAFLAIIIAFPMLTGPVIPAFYETAYPSLILIGGATLVNSAFGLGSTFLLMVNKGATVRNFSALQLLVLLITGYFCAIMWGGVGIAIGCLVGSVARDAPLMFAAFRLIRAGRQSDSSGT